MARFHPDLVGARWMPRAPVSPRTLPLVRGLSKLLRPPRGVEVAPVSDSARVWLYGRADAARPALLWIHGGGMVIGSPAQDHSFCARVSRELGVLVASVDYRLAPEHPYPAPLDDCYAALRWLAPRCSAVAVGGASAGGGLAAGTALAARDRGEVSLALQLLVYPMIDDRTVLRADVDDSHMRLWSPAANRFGWRSYLGVEPGAPDVWEYAAPARAKSLAGLPPAWIGVGTHDLFYDEDVAYARRLRESGVACELEVVEGAYHGFDAASAWAGVSKRFRDAQIDALRRALAPASPAPER